MENIKQQACIVFGTHWYLLDFAISKKQKTKRKEKGSYCWLARYLLDVAQAGLKLVSVLLTQLGIIGSAPP